MNNLKFSEADLLNYLQRIAKSNNVVVVVADCKYIIYLQEEREFSWVDIFEVLLDKNSNAYKMPKMVYSNLDFRTFYQYVSNPSDGNVLYSSGRQINKVFERLNEAITRYMVSRKLAII